MPTTPYSAQLDVGTYTIQMPASAVISGNTYVFSRWEDNSTNPIRVINLTKAATTTLAFGNQNIGSGNQGADKIVGSVFTTEQDGTATSITVGVRSSSGSPLKLTGAIYRLSDFGLVAVTQEISVPAWYEGWQTLTFASNQPQLTAGTNYILAAFSENSAGNFLSIYYTSGNPNQGIIQPDLPYPNYPNNLYPNYNDFQYSIYCTYTTTDTTISAYYTLQQVTLSIDSYPIPSITFTLARV